MAFLKVIQSTLFRKILMSLTGLFLAFFLIIHLLGNFQLLLDPEIAREQYNWYSTTLSHNILIEIVAKILYVSLLLHILDALYITIKNRQADGRNLKVDTRGKVSYWHSRNMGVLGVVILIFLVIHLKDYWYIYKFGELPLDEQGQKDLYTIVIASFKNIWYVIIYLLGFIGLGFHLAHGVASGFRTLGLYHKTWVNIMKYIGIAFAILIPLAYAIIPVIIYIKNL
ncbi:MAG TPA: succinate dehydrogenase cytochrome b subunit [Saprospiraceae bacterium]|nr:succinate dehydrogenase cytochrome b subunit [Saprospiraceae bacterium]